ncbi:hypothetical protein LCGC14_0345020 [marine sediment metagenome]|uniref:DUF3307 domain-containing protein n=1 Tax=marine sediment metagenome TaxID=412755 RepID=A0A0F9W031_9ZZZZ
MVLFLFFVGHALADFALQPDVMAKLKSRKNKPDWIPDGQKYVPCWYYWLTAHSLIHGGVVALITGSVWLGIAELVVHWAADFAKCEGWTNPNGDQAIHGTSKIAWWVLWLI